MDILLSEQVADPENVRENFKKIGKAFKNSGGSLPAGGTTGQIIKKQSNIDYDVNWEDAPLLAWGFGGDISDQTDLISGGKILTSLLPALAITDTNVVSSEAEMLALTAETGDIAVRTDETKTYILKGSDPSVLADWELLLTPTGGVVSVFGRSGAVTAQSGDYSFSLISGVVGTSQGGAPSGGATGYVLTKNSATDYDYGWAAAAGGIPSMTGNGGKWLTNDGTVASWAINTGWSTSGNALTSPSTNFIGTTDNQNLSFRINNLPVGLLTPTSFAFGDLSGTTGASYQTIKNDGLYFSTVGSTNRAIMLGSIGTAVPMQALYAVSNSIVQPIFTTKLATQLISSASVGAQYQSLTLQSNKFPGLDVESIIFNNSFSAQPKRIIIYGGNVGNEPVSIIPGGDGSLIVGAYASGKVSNSVFTVVSTTQGSIPAPKMTSTNWGMISKAEGLQGWDTDNHAQLWFDGTGTIGFKLNRATGKFQGYDGTNWIDLN